MKRVHFSEVSVCYMTEWLKESREAENVENCPHQNVDVAVDI